MSGHAKNGFACALSTRTFCLEHTPYSSGLYRRRAQRARAARWSLQKHLEFTFADIFSNDVYIRSAECECQSIFLARFPRALAASEFPIFLMKINSIGEEIASAELRLKGTEEDFRIVVRVGRPQQFPESSGYYCPFQFEGLGLPIRFGAGEDGIQALELALKNLKAELLYLNSEMYEGRLCWSNGADL